MSTNQYEQSAITPLVNALADAIRNDRLDEAQALLAQLYEVHPAAQEVLVFPIVIAIRRGHALDALRHLNSLPDGRCDELKALCLYELGDPTWHSYAEAKADDSDPFIREAMRRMLGRPSDQQPPPTPSPI